MSRQEAACLPCRVTPNEAPRRMHPHRRRCLGWVTAVTAMPLVAHGVEAGGGGGELGYRATATPTTEN
jgi:hypothetical protein